MKKIIIALISIILFYSSSIAKKTPKEQKPLNKSVNLPRYQTIKKITFGSCCRQNKKAPLLFDIAKEKAELFIWTGDVVYADSTDPNVVTAKYQQQKIRPGYQKILATSKVIGTWDDHDYGFDNSGAEFPAKVQNQKLFLDFLNEPNNSPRRKQKGIYTSYTYGKKNTSVKIIVLDTRYHKNLKGKNPTILGKKQWKWLENEILNSKAKVNLIISSIQIIPLEHRFEKWADLPSERKKFMNLLLKYKEIQRKNQQNSKTLIISGDRHLGEISKLPLSLVNPNQNKLIEHTEIYEATSSGINQKAGGYLKYEKNKYRVNDKILDHNYGVIEFNWKKFSKNPPKIIIKIKGQNQTILNKVIIN